VPRLGVTGPPELTPTQWRVVEGVAAGLSDREIAERLHLSVHTVHERVAALHEVCGTRTRPQLVAALAATRSP
jgi:DNA-binding NarL/FixJ family response regulator